MPICKICGKECKNYGSLSKHVKNVHNINKESYYLDYIGNKDDDKCKICKINKTRFISITKGFKPICLNCARKSKKDLNFFIITEGDYEKGLNKYNNYKNQMKGRYSQEWFQEKYGEEEGNKKYYLKKINL